MSDNPFSEHEDSDRTVIRPVPAAVVVRRDAGGTPAIRRPSVAARAPPRRYRAKARKPSASASAR